jgi:L-2,4-diaminobutyrate transaminase
MASPQSLHELDKRSLLHPFTSIEGHLERGPRIMVEGEGIRVRDDGGREYIDAMAGLWCVNVGYGRGEIVDAMAEQARRLPYYHAFLGHSNEPAIRLADRLLAMAPGSMRRVFFGTSGSDANDTQVKLVWLYNNLRGRPEKKKLIARRGGYHGVTVAAGSLTGLPLVHQAFDLPLPGFLHVRAPHHWREAPPGLSEPQFSARLAEELDAVIEQEGPETVAAFFAEPVMAAGGVVVPPEGYFEAIVPVLRRHDVLLVVDEVVCGFGRLGTPFGSDAYGLEPDLVTLAKGLTSAYVPMSACLVAERIWEVLRKGSPEVATFAHGYTYTAHPVAAAAGLANLDILEREGLVERAARVGKHLQGRLRAAVASHPLVGEVRGTGMIAGVELVADRAEKRSFDATLGVAPRLHARLLEEGLICRPVGQSLAFSPPLIASEADVDEMVDRFTRGLDAFASELEQEGSWHS